MRGDLSMLIELTRDSGISERKKRKIMRRYKIKEEQDISTEKKVEAKDSGKGTKIKAI